MCGEIGCKDGFIPCEWLSSITLAFLHKHFLLWSPPSDALGSSPHSHSSRGCLGTALQSLYSRCIPDISMERDVLHIHLLLCHLGSPPLSLNGLSWECFVYISCAKILSSGSLVKRKSLSKTTYLCLDWENLKKKGKKKKISITCCFNYSSIYPCILQFFLLQSEDYHNLSPCTNSHTLLLAQKFWFSNFCFLTSPVFPSLMHYLIISTCSGLNDEYPPPDMPIPWSPNSVNPPLFGKIICAYIIKELDMRSSWIIQVCLKSNNNFL